MIFVLTSLIRTTFRWKCHCQGMWSDCYKYLCVVCLNIVWGWADARNSTLSLASPYLLYTHSPVRADNPVNVPLLIALIWLPLRRLYITWREWKVRFLPVIEYHFFHFFLAVLTRLSTATLLWTYYFQWMISNLIPTLCGCMQVHSLKMINKRPGSE